MLIIEPYDASGPVMIENIMERTINNSIFPLVLNPTNINQKKKIKQKGHL